MVALAVQGIDLFKIAGRSGGLRASRQAILVMSGNHSVARWKSDSFFIYRITLRWPAPLVAILVSVRDHLPTAHASVCAACHWLKL